MMALKSLKRNGLIAAVPVKEYLAAISVGIREGEVLLDLDYEEDSAVDVDCNMVMTGSGELIEIQGTGEKGTFSREQLREMLDCAGPAIQELIALQKDALSLS